MASVLECAQIGPPRIVVYAKVGLQLARHKHRKPSGTIAVRQGEVRRAGILFSLGT